MTKRSPAEHAQLNDWDDIRFVLALSRAGSLKEAAQTLGVNQSTVYRRIQQCESELGVKLFDRSTQGHELTPAGMKMLSFAERTEEGIEVLVTELHGHDASLAGSIHITSTDTISSTLLLPALSDFRTQYPGIHLHVSINSQHLDLSRREADVALRPTLSPPSHLSGVCLCKDDWAVYGVRGEALPTSASELGEFDAVGGDQELAKIPAMAWFIDHTKPERVIMNTSSVATSIEMIKMQLCIGVLPGFVGDADSELVRAPLSTGHTIEVWLLTHPEIRKAARIRALFDFMTQRFAEAS